MLALSVYWLHFLRLFLPLVSFPPRAAKPVASSLSIQTFVWLLPSVCVLAVGLPSPLASPWWARIWLIESFLVTLKIRIYTMKCMLWNIHSVTLIRVSACIPLEIFWFVWLLLSISSIFRIRQLPFMNFTLCHMQFIRCIPCDVLAYILLFRGYFRRLCTLCGPMKQIIWYPIGHFSGTLYFDTRNKSYLAPFLCIIQ